MKTIYIRSLLVALFLMRVACGYAQDPSERLLKQQWNAFWISVPRQPEREYSVFLFRKTLNLESKPATFVVHVSADNRYKLYVNGKLASLGPARGDIFHWNYETVDLAPFLTTGSNTIGAVVWNEGELAPEAQQSYKTGFILQGDTEQEEVANTNESWRCKRDLSVKPLVPKGIRGYYAAGAGELVDMNQQVNGWMDPRYDASEWESARKLIPGLPKGVFSYNDGWMLVPSPLPPMELKEERLVSTRKSDMAKVPTAFPASKASFSIPAHTKASFLLDQGHLTNAYFNALFSKGKEAKISISYAEALYESSGKKGNRNIIKGKEFSGKTDEVISSGAEGQQFTTLWWRTYRYVMVNIETAAEPLVIEDMYGTFTGYPFKYQAKFASNRPDLLKILETGWRTARLCAFETYMDCPYYEQLQYIGDTRIQAMISYYDSGDERLARNAITLADQSRLAEGITMSRYPTRTAQEIPTFSLWWIGMLHDYWMYRPDSSFVKEKLPGERQVLSFFERYQAEDGSLVNLPYWTFTDWAEGKGWKNGMAPIGKNGNSCVLDLQLLWAYQVAAELEDRMGMKEYAQLYQRSAGQLKQTIRKKYWDDSKGMYADQPEKDTYSQHANALAILTGMTVGQQANTLGLKILNDTSMTPATIYFKYYVHQALVKAGLGNEYLDWLGIWRENLKQGLTTWAEISDISAARSDCHAWGASPNIEFYRTVLGIDTDAPGFSRVKITPHLGSLKQAAGEIPHPAGTIKASYVNRGKQWTILITLPEKTSGSLVWKGKEYQLKGGANEFKI